MDKFDTVAEYPLVIHWRLVRHFFFSWEVSVDALTGLVPSSLDVVEVRPGIGLLSTGVLRYEGQHFGQESPEFSELVSAVHVQPDLSVKMPMPRFSFYALKVFSDSREFVEQEGRVLFTPTEYVPSLRCLFSEDGRGVDVHDDRGPVLSLRSSHDTPDYCQAEFWGQHYTDTNQAQVQRGVWEWDGQRFEHMKGGAAGKLHQHPFFQGLDVKAIRSCYRQMISAPSAKCNERFYRMTNAHVG